MYSLIAGRLWRTVDVLPKWRLLPVRHSVVRERLRWTRVPRRLRQHRQPRDQRLDTQQPVGVTSERWMWRNRDVNTQSVIADAMLELSRGVSLPADRDESLLTVPRSDRGGWWQLFTTKSDLWTPVTFESIFSTFLFATFALDDSRWLSEWRKHNCWGERPAHLWLQTSRQATGPPTLLQNILNNQNTTNRIHHHHKNKQKWTQTNKKSTKNTNKQPNKQNEQILLLSLKWFGASDRQQRSDIRVGRVEGVTFTNSFWSLYGRWHLYLHHVNIDI